MTGVSKSTDPSALFRAFADPTRLRILNLLKTGELCVCDVCEVLGEIQPKISRHLAYLRRTGLITARQHGRWAFYQLTEQPTAAQKALLACIGTCLADFEVLARDLKRLKTLRRRERACA